jgi:hypothetical protein
MQLKRKKNVLFVLLRFLALSYDMEKKHATLFVIQLFKNSPRILGFYYNFVIKMLCEKDAQGKKKEC